MDDSRLRVAETVGVLSHRLALKRVGEAYAEGVRVHVSLDSGSGRSYLKNSVLRDKVIYSYGRAGSDRADEYLHTLVHKSLIRALGLRDVRLVILEDELQLYAVNAARLVDLVNRDLSRVANRLTVSRRRAGKRTYAADDDLIT